MLNEMWVKCSVFSYFSLFIAWAVESSFYLLGINGWCILILFICKRLSGVFHTSFYLFFSYLRTHEYTHPSVTSMIFTVHFVLMYFFWLLLLSFLIWLPLSNGNIFSQPMFSSCIYHFSGRELRVSPKLQRKPMEGEVPSCSLSLDVTQTSMAPDGVSPLPPFAVIDGLNTST